MVAVVMSSRTDPDDDVVDVTSLSALDIVDINKNGCRRHRLAVAVVLDSCDDQASLCFLAWKKGLTLCTVHEWDDTGRQRPHLLFLPSEKQKIVERQQRTSAKRQW